MNKKQLEIQLSKLKNLVPANPKLEQYQTEGNTTAQIIWKAYISGDIENKVIADLGCGNGIFGIGALILGAKKVLFLDADKKAIELTKENTSNYKNCEYYNCDITQFNKKVHTVLMNPPFGVQNRKADKKFLEKAFQISKNIYSIHKIESKNFIEKIAQENDFKIEEIIPIKLLIKKVYEFHKKKYHYTDVGIWILRKK